MSECKHLQFTIDNYVESDSMVLTSTPASVTNLEWLRNYDAAEVAKWTNLEGDIVIEGTTEDDCLVNYFAIPDSNLNSNATIRLELFSLAGDTVAVYDSGIASIGEMVALGEWAAGIDAYGVSDSEPLNTVRAFWFDEQITVQKFRLTISHGYGYTEPVVTTTTEELVVTTSTESDGIFRQDSSGTVSIEAESGTTTDAGLDMWENRSDSGASSGRILLKTGAETYSNANEGPSVDYEFTPSQSGSHDVWVRVRSYNSLGSSFYAIFDGNSQYVSFDITTPFVWIKARTITLVAEQQGILTIAARDKFVILDKIVIKTSGSSTPTYDGPDESGFGTITTTTTTGGGTTTTTTAATSTDSVQLRNLMMGNTLELENNLNYGSSISFLTDPDLRVTHSGRSIIARPQRLSRRLSLSLSQMSEIDRWRLWQLEAQSLGRPLLVNAYPTHSEWFSGNYIFLARFADKLKYKHISDTRHSTTIDLIEV